MNRLMYVLMLGVSIVPAFIIGLLVVVVYGLTTATPTEALSFVLASIARGMQ